jgi:hypothetical protein
MELRLTFPVLAVLAAAGAAIPAQQPTPGEKSPNFTSETTEVLVPALVRDAAGKVVYTLQAGDFVLTDDGVPQKLILQQETGGEPLALVIVIEVGGAGSRQFQNFERLAPPLAPMLPSIVGNVRHRVAVVTFDSSPKLIQGLIPDPTSKWSKFYDCVAQLVPPLTFAKMAAIATGDSLQKNVPTTVSRLTGGEYFKLGSERNLEQDLTAIGNHMPNRVHAKLPPAYAAPGATYAETEAT